MYVCLCVSAHMCTHPGFLFFCLAILCSIQDLLQPGIEPVLPALETWSLSHWTQRGLRAHTHMYFCPAGGRYICVNRRQRGVEVDSSYLCTPLASWSIKKVYLCVHITTPISTWTKMPSESPFLPPRRKRQWARPTMADGPALETLLMAFVLTVAFIFPFYLGALNF